VIPVIAKADTMTEQELAEYRTEVSLGLTVCGLGHKGL